MFLWFLVYLKSRVEALSGEEVLWVAYEEKY